MTGRHGQKIENSVVREKKHIYKNFSEYLEKHIVVIHFVNMMKLS